MDSLKQPSIKRIGLHGMPGVGKTTLAKEVKRRSHKEKLFDAVVLAAVTKTPDLKRIQAEIARDLDLVLPNGNEEREPDVSIKKMLEDKTNVLVILDDVWAKLDLNEIGIPLEHTGLKILLTSRNRDVLSRELCSDKNIKVGQLQDKEAWKLFVDVVGADAERNDLKQIAIQIVQKCGGLPLAIVTLGTALRGRESDDWWHDALEQLKNPAPESFEGVSGEVYAAIEFSYNHLRADGPKKTFLLCSFLCQLEDNIELLVRYAVGLDLFPIINTIKATRDRVLTSVSMLKDAALLIDVNSNRKFGIHDVVRDVAMAIAARDNFGLLLEDEKRLDMDALTKFNCIFLSKDANVIGDLPNDIEFPLLTLFHLQPYGRLRNDLTSFFKGMQKLKVLNVSTRRMPNACLSLSFLTNLRSLTIQGVDDVTVLGELKNLEVLCIHGGIIELPSEVGKLTLLKVLDLRGCYNLKVISQNGIRNLSRLEELYFHRELYGSPGIQWELAENGEQRNASLTELAYLHRLTVLHLSIQDVRILPTNAIDWLSRLENFQMSIGPCYPSNFSVDYSRTLWLEMNKGSCLDRSIGKLLEKTEALRLRTMTGLKNVVYELDVEGFQELKKLQIESALEMQYIVNSVDRVDSNAFPILETLILRRLQNLEGITHGRVGETSFSKLKEVRLHDCHQIKILFSLSMVRQLLQLQKISVDSCDKMVGIVDEEGQGETSNEIVEATRQKIELSQLRSLHLDNVPEFISFCYGKKSSLIDEDKQNQLTNYPSSRPIPLFNNEVVIPNLEELELRSIEIKIIWHISATAYCIMNLTELTIQGCDNLELLFSSSMARGLKKLCRLKIKNCKNIREIIATENVEDMENSISFPELTFLELKNLQNLVKFYSGNCMIEFPSLKQLAIGNCRKLKGPTVTSTSTDAMADGSTLFSKQVCFLFLTCLSKL
ncbi:hypothetical protein SLEP1_g1797 [Rubroshorea leprosula]|uniref:AAA+ ATPase domain-containing protein n=1 Tax=Rubroshorea leprosula TaxID=152421 RepID=A0AAV5HPI4_9ROSI|nr:hypothetical protein SLEP1_g1797 [Rubroshorea leprosula]